MNIRFFDAAYRIGSALFASLVLAWLCCLATLMTLPCGVMGSSDQMVCSTAVFRAVSLVGLVVLTVGFVALLRNGFELSLGMRARPRADLLDRINTWWLALLAAYFLSPLISVLPFINGMTALISLLVLPAFVVASAMLAPHRGRHPAVAFIALVPIFGAIVVAFILWRTPAKVAF